MDPCLPHPSPSVRTVTDELPGTPVCGNVERKSPNEKGKSSESSFSFQQQSGDNKGSPEYPNRSTITLAAPLNKAKEEERLRLEALQELPPDSVEMPTNRESLNNEDICYFCGEGSIEIEIYFCDGFCQRAICALCLKSKSKLSDPWYCDECRNNIARCVFCSRPSRIWHLDHPLFLPIDLTKKAKSDLEKTIRTEYVFRCAKQNCPSFFHLDCIPRDPLTGNHICYAKAKAPSSLDAPKGVSNVYRWYCSRHECDCRRLSKMFSTVVAHGQKRYCFRCPCSAHFECAKSNGWKPIINSEMLMLCNKHNLDELYFPLKHRYLHKRPITLAELGPEYTTKDFYPLRPWLRYFKPPRDDETPDIFYKINSSSQLSSTPKLPPFTDTLLRIRLAVSDITKAAANATDDELIKMRKSIDRILEQFDERIEVLWD